VSAASASAWSANAVCVATISRRLGSRSLITPPNTERKSIGRNWSALIAPSLKGELVSSRTSQDWPSDCIQVPMSETNWLTQKSRKSRCSSADSPAGSAMPPSPPSERPS
jgi:hypothetical protein